MALKHSSRFDFNKRDATFSVILHSSSSSSFFSFSFFFRLIKSKKTNVLVCATVGAGRDEHKRKRALGLIESMDFGTSAQVLQEFYVTVVKKASRPLSPAQALEWIEQWTAFPCQAIDHQLVLIAVEHSARYAISYWDAAIVAAAEALGPHTVYSEDLNDGHHYGRVRVLNPFS